MFKTKDSVIIVMECVDGGTYKNRYSDSNDMTLDEIKFYFSRLCSALTSTEKSGIVHRDLKPDNILISAEGEIKLGDYGIAVLKDDDFEARLVIGTPKYMSPESTVGLQLSKLSDIYSLGVMLYESATGT
ncbi:hypothetical protein Zmor_012271 [Zophobas morio]|uniref:Protein kinase domain-containing protein n=1 Tax=Zophobas morio TaxID=2755281 RepID=A0AA38HF76_9CUCU|nr:hypothetical protein Zmor_012271 [Zophobas morio]